jgi:SAM-dependent methyltransferase
MRDDEALALLRPAMSDHEGGVWADLGAGTGVFTRALATLLGPEGHVHAVDADARALSALRASLARTSGRPTVTAREADFTRPLDLPPLDGVLMANALHFARDAGAVLALAASYLRPGGRLVLVEYQGRGPNPWVPYPVPSARFAELAPAAGLTRPDVVATRPSAFGGQIYVAVASRKADEAG